MQNSNLFDWMNTGGGIGNLFGSGIGYDTAAEGIRDAQNPINDYYQKALSYLQPYMQGGTQALGNLQRGYQQMQDPSAYVNKILGEWRESPAERYQRQQGINSINANLATGGLTGSGAEAKALQNYGQQQTAQGQQNYFNTVYGVNRDYLGGQQNLYGRGLNSATSMADLAQKTGMSLADLQRLAAQADAKSDSMFGSGIGSVIGATIPFLI
jgi:hypothetical protein